MKLNTRKLMIQYCILQGSYWASFCVIYAFATVFLLSRGFESSMIGVIIAAGNILGVILQPMVASIADRSEKISLHKLTAMLSVIMILLLVLLYFVPNGLLAVAVLFLLTDTFLQVIQPLINSVSVYYVNQGVSVDFGSARGIGSLSYAAASYILGIVVEKFGTRSILMAGILVALVLLVTVLSMPVLSSSAASRLGEKEPEQNDAGLLVFAGRYKNFMLTLAGITLLFTFHNMNNAYLIKVIENVGGTSADMGRMLSIAAVTELPVMFLFSRISKHFKSSTLLMVSSAFFAIRAAGFMLAGNVMTMYLAAMLQIGSFALYIPSSVYYVNETMLDQDKFKGQAVMTATNTLGGVFGSLFGGFLIDNAGVGAMNTVCFAMAAAGAVLVFLFAGRHE
ncbi:MFS transporter [Clostridiaceae bacterium Marseille-Q4143]|nr:MFS transporter [Clostridiaceae bacterium Marseille-Q4143]